MSEQAVIVMPPRGVGAWIEDKDKIALLKKQIMPKDATDLELSLFLHVVKQTGLDPFTRQIYAIRRNGKMSIETSIDGARLAADRTEQYRGQTQAQWCDDEGKWYDVWLKTTPPAAARVGVYRADFVEPLVATAKFCEYKPADSKQDFMWRKMPALMISKVAEMLALRRAFPEKFSGVYSSDEMSQSDNQTSLPIDNTEIIRLKKGISLAIRALTDNGKNRELKAEICSKMGIQSFKEIANCENINTLREWCYVLDI